VHSPTGGAEHSLWLTHTQDKLRSGTWALWQPWHPSQTQRYAHVWLHPALHLNTQTTAPSHNYYRNCALCLYHWQWRSITCKYRSSIAKLIIQCRVIFFHTLLNFYHINKNLTWVN
jgi:hypothetical protein